MSTAEDISAKIFTTTSTVSDLGFFSIESASASLGLDGCIAQMENLYKIVSTVPIENSMVAKLLGKPQNSTLEDLSVRWIHRQIWPRASPQFSNTALLDNIELSDSVFYTGLADKVVSSLEMSCRVGRLAAHLLYYSKRSPPLEI